MLSTLKEFHIQPTYSQNATACPQILTPAFTHHLWDPEFEWHPSCEELPHRQSGSWNLSTVWNRRERGAQDQQGWRWDEVRHKAAPKAPDGPVKRTLGDLNSSLSELGDKGSGTVGGRSPGTRVTGGCSSAWQEGSGVG